MLMVLASQIEGEHIALIAVVGGLTVVILTTVGGMVQSIMARRQIEESRREIAAYVAEGSMTPEDAERLLNAGARPRNRQA
jgi:3-hydroxyacyl-CoA dehydrogenase